MLNKETYVKVNFRCKAEYKYQLKGASCIVHISLGQDYHEGEKFLATMDLINETFSFCTLILCDTLQRHTLLIKDNKISENEAYEKALKLGDEWLKRNINAYKYLTIPLQIYRWDDWLKHKNFYLWKNKIEQLYNKDSNYHYCLHSTIQRFLSRQPEIEKGTEEYERAFKISETYLLEECPILIPLWAETNSEFVVYPRFRTKAMSTTYDYFIKEGKLLKEVALKFNHRVKPKKLSFSYMKDKSKKEDVFVL